MIRVVVYDDNVSRLKSLQTLIDLNDEMKCVGCFEKCSHVIEDMKLLHPDVVLMDIEMPETNGIEGTRMIKQSFPTVKIIIQTVFEDDEKIFSAMQAGAEGYVLKNASADKILQSIAEVNDGGAFMTPSVALKVMKYFKTNPSKEATYSLTNKEKEVLQYLSDGLSYKMVAEKLSISYFTVNSHIKKIYEKLQVHSLGEAISKAIRDKIVRN